MSTAMPGLFNGRQNLDEWMRKIEALTTLNGLTDGESIAFARTQLAPEIRRGEATNANLRTSLAALQTYLQGYLRQNDRFCLGALDQIRDKKYTLDQDPRDFKRQINLLFDIAQVGNELEKVRLLEEMLPNEVYSVVIGATPNTINEAITVMERYWRRSRRSYIQDSDDPQGTENSDASVVKILANALLQKNERPARRDTSEGSSQPYCKYCQRKGHSFNDCRARRQNPGPSFQRFQGKCHYCGIPGHQEQDCRRKASENHRPTPSARHFPKFPFTSSPSSYPLTLVQESSF